MYGITVDRLGRDHLTSARNGALVMLGQNARSSARGAGMIEALATGIPTMLRALEAARMPAPQFHDQGIRFTVILRREEKAKRAARQLGASERRVYEALRAGAASVAELEELLDMKGPTIRKVLRTLREKKLVLQHGGKGKPGRTSGFPMSRAATFRRRERGDRF